TNPNAWRACRGIVPKSGVKNQFCGCGLVVWPIFSTRSSRFDLPWRVARPFHARVLIWVPHPSRRPLARGWARLDESPRAGLSPSTKVRCEESVLRLRPGGLAHFFDEIVQV